MVRILAENLPHEMNLALVTPAVLADGKVQPETHPVGQG